MQTAYAPGRVELLGNHTDYNEGYVLSAAIDRGITLSGRATGDERILLHSRNLDRRHEARLGCLSPVREEEWANYPLGVLEIFRQEGLPVSGVEIGIEGDLPLGAGLSSSAALEVSTGKLLEKLFALKLDPLRLAKLCRRAENEFVGVNCGLLDQVSSVFGREDHVIFLDCREETVRTTPLPPGVSLLITECGVPHRLSGGEYNERREQCFDAAAKLGARALRDVSRERLEAGRGAMPELSYRRALHIVGENERVLAGIAALERGDVEAFGALMSRSHESSQHHFENSTPELDALVAIARGLPGVLGARLTGGGFGGATVTLVRSGESEAVAAALITRYREETGHTATIHHCRAAGGAR